MYKVGIAFAAWVVLFGASWSSADVFNMGDANLKNLEFVAVGDPGNTADHTGYGSVPYTYQMGKYDVTAAQYCKFLNAVATQSDPFGLYNTAMFGHLLDEGACGIAQTGGPGNYTYTATGCVWGVYNPNFPVNLLSWGSMARFANWLSNGQPAGPEGPGTTETGSYMLNGATTSPALAAVTRTGNAKYVIPTEAEWYKAAYYDPNKPGGAGYWVYPTRSDTAPTNLLDPNGTNNANCWIAGNEMLNVAHGLTSVGTYAGSPGPYGTFDMGGDICQLVETNSGGNGLRGSWNADPCEMASSHRNYTDPASWQYYFGFRVAEVPEPLSAALLVVGNLLFSRRGVRRS